MNLLKLIEISIRVVLDPLVLLWLRGQYINFHQVINMSVYHHPVSIRVQGLIKFHLVEYYHFASGLHQGLISAGVAVCGPSQVDDRLPPWSVAPGLSPVLVQMHISAACNWSEFGHILLGCIHFLMRCHSKLLPVGSISAIMQLVVAQNQYGPPSPDSAMTVLSNMVIGKVINFSEIFGKRSQFLGYSALQLSSGQFFCGARNMTNERSLSLFITAIIVSAGAIALQFRDFKL